MKSESNEKMFKLNFLFYLVYIFSYLIIFEFYEDNDFIFDIKHYVLFFCCGFSFLSLYIKYGRNLFKEKLRGKKGSFLVLITGIVFILISIQKGTATEMGFHLRSLVQTFLFLTPILYVFSLCNLYSDKKITFLLKVTTIIFIFFYFMESRHTLLSFFDINNWLSINILDSESFTESHICAETFLQLFLYFFYIDNYTENEIKGVKLYKNLNMIFSVLSFKRLALLFLFLIVIFKKMIKYDKSMKRNYNIVIAIIFVFLTIIYTGMLQGKYDLGFDINKFSTNRAWILSLWTRKKYFSYGYGTSLYVIGRYLEMDLVQIYLELGTIPLFMFCYSLKSLSGKKIYTNLILLYALFNLLTSSTMPWTSGWVMLAFNLIVIESNSFKNKNKELIYE